jgi:hypothetical protein
MICMLNEGRVKAPAAERWVGRLDEMKTPELDYALRDALDSAPEPSGGDTRLS